MLKSYSLHHKLIGSENCNTDSSNICYGSDGALRCLSLAGDFAVIILPGNTRKVIN